LWDEVMVSDLKFFDGSLARIDRIPAELRAMYATAFEIDPSWLVEAAARRQKWIDQAQSLNIYMAGASGKKLHDVYSLAWMRGLKTTYYLRTLGASSAEKSTTDRLGQLNAVSSEGLGAAGTAIAGLGASAGVGTGAGIGSSAVHRVHAGKGGSAGRRVGSGSLEGSVNSGSLEGAVNSGISGISGNPGISGSPGSSGSSSGATRRGADRNGPLPKGPGNASEAFCVIDDPDCEACQ